jgi:hypothetical protein
MQTEEKKDKIIGVERRTEIWFENGEQKSCVELAIYTPSTFMQFALDDKCLPADIETNYQNYLLCKRRFEPGKRQSNTGLTSVWFEAAQP